MLSRVVQAIGASMLMANGPALITASFPSFERGKALGIMAMVVSAGLISGPSVGGILISQLGWRSIFWVNVPIGLIGIFLVYRNVAADLVPRTRPSFDWLGAGLQTLVMLSFIVLFDPPVVSFSGSAAFLAAPLDDGARRRCSSARPSSRWNPRCRAPLLDLSLLQNRTFSTANLASFFIFVAFSSVSVLMPFFLEEVLRLAPQAAGLYMTAIPLTILVVAPISGRMSDRLGSQGLSLSGALIGALALLAMGGAFGKGMYESMSQPGVVLALASIGLATGLFQSPNNNAIMGAVPHAKLGVASAMLATVRNLGLVTGTGLSTGLFTWRMEVTHDFVASLHFSFFVAGLVAVAAMAAGIAKGWKHGARGPTLVTTERPHSSSSGPSQAASSGSGSGERT